MLIGNGNLPATPVDRRPVTNELPTRPLPPVGARFEEPLFVPTETLQSFIQSYHGILPNSSSAYRENPYWQMAMRQDAGTEGILRNLRVSLARLPWSIVPDKERAKEAKLEQLGRDVTRVIRSAPRQTELWYNQHGAVWYGGAAANIVYKLRGSAQQMSQLVIGDIRALASDSLAFDKWSNLGVAVGADYQANGGTGYVVQGLTSPVRLFDPVQRQAVFYHRVFTEAPEFLLAYSADTQFRGRGARDVAWPMWQMKMQVLRAAVSFANTYGNGGIRQGYFPESNPTAKGTMKSILGNLDKMSAISLPWIQGLDKANQPWQFELHSMPAGTGDVYVKLLEFFDRYIKQSLLGQSLSTEAGSTGMGSGVAKLHGDSLVNTLRYHACACGESADLELVRPICAMLGAAPEDAEALHLKFSVRETDAKEFMEAVGPFLANGGTAKMDEVRENIGLSKPEPGDELMQAPAPQGDIFGTSKSE